MRAILINPYKQTITDIDLATNEDGPTYEALKYAVFTDRPLGYIESVDFGSNIIGYLDEEGLLMDWSNQAFVEIHGRTFAGNVVLTSRDAELPTFITPKTVNLLVRWLRPEDVVVPAPKVYDGAGNIIDDQGDWTFENQPR